jgi:diguanylate cyclase (GGDEF)-like protein/PAS domain S-box-containing protein
VAVAAEASTRRLDRLEDEWALVHGTLDALSQAVLVTDRHAVVAYVNPAGLDMLGLKADEALGLPLQHVLTLYDGEVDDEMAPIAALDLTPCLHEGLRLFVEEVTLRRRDGRRRPIEGNAAPIRDPRKSGALEDAPIVGAVLVLTDTSRQHKAQRWQRAAIFDGLTGLLNREAFEEHVTKALQRGLAVGDRCATVLHLDLDQFQVINEACGHLAGDQLILWVASLVRERLRHDDVLSRLGGDEFALLVPETTLEGAMQLAEDIHSAFRFFRFVWQGKSYRIDLSIGIVPFSAGFGSAAEVLGAAEQACSLAKTHGRAKTQIFRRDADELVERQGLAQWAIKIKQALDEDLFVLYWQRIHPLAPPAGGRPLLFETLIRLRDRDGRIHPPGDFLAAAERYDLSQALDRWVVRQTFRAVVRQSPSFHEALDVVTVNLSGASVGDRGMLEFIEQQLDATGCPAERICFEITETAAVSNLHRAVQMIEALRRRGCRWALDDFGSGMASYRYLSELPVDFIKIDGKIVADILSSPLSWTMVQSIHQIAHVMGARTVGERVENAEILEELERLGVDYGQGFHIERPRPLAELEPTPEIVPGASPVRLPSIPVTGGA